MSQTDITREDGANRNSKFVCTNDDIIYDGENDDDEGETSQ